MNERISFAGMEKRLVPKFREQLGSAKSANDVRDLFSHTVADLMNAVSNGREAVSSEDIALEPGSIPSYRISDRLEGDPLWRDLEGWSDLLSIISRFADASKHRYAHLSRHAEKTKLKIRSEGRLGR